MRSENTVGSRHWSGHLLTGICLLVVTSACGRPDNSAQRHPAVGAVAGGTGGAAGGDAQGGDAQGGDAAGGAGAAAGAGAAVPLIDEALDGTCAGGDPVIDFPSYLVPGDDLHRVTLQSPTALCNDGSPAVIYVRQGSAAGVDDWVLYLGEGRGCWVSYEACKDRWCGAAPYNRSLMSSAFAPEAIGGRGIFSQRSDNSFRNANQAFFYYCSSDTWSGQASDVVVTHPDDATLQYRIHYRGHSIIDAAMTVLLAGGATSDDGAVTMPALTDAARVMLSGASAGSHGIAHNADWMTSRLPPGADVAAVFDTGSAPAPELAPNAQVHDAMLAAADAFWDDHMQPMNSFVDTSCAPNLPIGTPQSLCGRPAYVRYHHITTPYFMRRDLLDPVGLTAWQNRGGTEAEFLDALRSMLLALADLPSTAIEGANITRAAGAYGPACSQHLALSDDYWFLDATVGDGGGQDVTYHDALAAWLGGAAVQLVDTVPPTQSTCPASGAGGSGGGS